MNAFAAMLHKLYQMGSSSCTLALAAEMGIELLTEEQYRKLQKLDRFSSIITAQTPNKAPEASAARLGFDGL